MQHVNLRVVFGGQFDRESRGAVARFLNEVIGYLEAPSRLLLAL